MPLGIQRRAEHPVAAGEPKPWALTADPATEQPCRTLSRA